MNKNKKIWISVGTSLGAIGLITTIVTPIVVINDNNNVNLSTFDSEKIYTALTNINEKVLNNNESVNEIKQKLNSTSTLDLIKKTLNKLGGEIKQFSKIIKNIKFVVDNEQYKTFNAIIYLDLSNVAIDIVNNNFFELKNDTLKTKTPVNYYPSPITIANPQSIIDTIKNYLNPANPNEKTYNNFISLVNDKTKINKLIQDINNLLSYKHGNKLIDINFQTKQNGSLPNNFEVTCSLVFNNKVNKNNLTNIFNLNSNGTSISVIKPFFINNLYYEIKDPSTVANIEKIQQNLSRFNDTQEAIQVLDSIQSITDNALNGAINPEYSKYSLVTGTCAKIKNAFSLNITLVFNNGFYTNIFIDVTPSFTTPNLKDDFTYSDAERKIINGLSSSGLSKTTLVVPSGITTIEFNSLNQVKSTLKAIYLPNTVTTLNCNIEGFKTLETIYFEQYSNLTTLNAIGSFCPNLTSISLPKTLNTLDNSFNQSPSLQEVDLPKSLTKISGFNYTGLTNIFIPKDCYIYQFGVTDSLLEIKFDPDYTQKKLDTHIFNAPNCKRIIFPKNGIITSNNCYNNLKNLEEIIFPYGLNKNGLFELGADSFINVSSNIGSLKINFSQCTNLTNQDYQDIQTKLINSFKIANSAITLNFIPPFNFLSTKHIVYTLSPQILNMNKNKKLLTTYYLSTLK